MKAHLVHTEAMRFQAQAEDGPPILFDAGERSTRKGPSPMQGALLAAMGCTASDVVWILRKERVPFTSLEIEGDAQRATTDPKVFAEIHLHFRVYGDGVKESDVKRAIDLSLEKYCSVGIMLQRGGVRFVNTYEILPPG
jgi:putative redox protein